MPLFVLRVCLLYGNIKGVVFLSFLREEPWMKHLSCKECEKMIPRFVAEGIKGSDIYRFKEHIDNCASCKEELTIQFLSSEGVAHLESGTSFHLENELFEYMSRALKARQMTVRMRTLMIVYEIAALFVIASIFIYAGS